MSRKAILFVLVFSVVVPWAAGVPVQGGLSPHPRDIMGGENPPPPLEEGNCQTERSDDYYGLGVRLGIYLAWLQAWVAFNFVPSEIPSTLDTNAIFLLAIILAMVRCTITRLIVQVDGLILMHLGAGTIFGVLSIWGYRTSLYVREGPAKGITHFGGFGTHLRLLLCVAFGSYGLFFWVKGIHGPDPTLTPGNQEGNPECLTLYTFMFGKFRADGGIRIFYIVMCTCSLIYWTIMLLASSLAAVARGIRLYQLARFRQWRTTSRLHFATGLNHKQLRYLFCFMSGYTLIWMIFSMVLVEFTLNYNNMWQVLGWRGRFWFPNQLIPATIGACGLVRVLYIGFQQWRSPANSNPSLEHDVPISPNLPVPKPEGRRVFRLFAARTLAGARDIYASWYQHHDDEMDPLLEGQSSWLRYLVSYLPWLVLIRWWHLADQDYEWNLYQNPHLQVKPLAPRSGPHGKTIPHDPNRVSWNNHDQTPVDSPRSAQFEKAEAASRGSNRSSPSLPAAARRR